MPAHLAPPLPSGCPWSTFTPPNVDWCEVERCAVIVGFPIQALVGLLIAIGLAQEWRLRLRDGPHPAYRIYLVALALLGRPPSRHCSTSRASRAIRRA